MDQGSVWRDPRKLPVPVPEAGIFDEPNIKICLNDEWASHIDGLLGRLLEPDAWIGTDEEIEAAIQEVLKLQATLNPEGECEVFPKAWTMWHEESLPVGDGSFVRTLDSAQEYGHFWDFTAPVNGIAFTNRFYLAAGTYLISLLGATGSNQGKLDLYVDNVFASGTFDFYTASFGRNFLTANSITVTDGWHILKGVVSGKHASSSGYGIRLTKMWFRLYAGD